MKSLRGQRIFQDIQRKVAQELKIEKITSYCDLYSDDILYCADHHDADRDVDEVD
jgi:hypothetical protein